MLRIVIGMSFAALVVGAVPAQAQKRACTYEECMSACIKLGGGSRQGGCSGFCDKQTRERKASGMCK